jgi:hypothetical protein
MRKVSAAASLDTKYFEQELLEYKYAHIDTVLTFRIVA